MDKTNKVTSMDVSHNLCLTIQILSHIFITWYLLLVYWNMVIKYWDCTTQFPHCWNCYVITDIIINIIMIDSIIVFINITVSNSYHHRHKRSCKQKPRPACHVHWNRHRGGTPFISSSGTGTKVAFSFPGTGIYLLVLWYRCRVPFPFSGTCASRVTLSFSGVGAFIVIFSSSLVQVHTRFFFLWYMYKLSFFHPLVQVHS